VFTLDSQDLKEGFYTAERNEDGTGVFEDDSQRRMLKLLDATMHGCHVRPLIGKHGNVPDLTKPICFIFRTCNRRANVLS
jgi:hypothetical protein